MKKSLFQFDSLLRGFTGSFAVFLCACSTTVPPKPDSSASFDTELGEFSEMPTARMGSLPFPGPFTLFTSADPAALGRHAYDGANKEGAVPETDRGIIYTRRAGFLDISHVRNAADMTAYIHARVHLALERGWGSMRFRSYEPSDYSVEFNYPDGWATLTKDQRVNVTDELAVRVAQLLAHHVMNWHEILTWYGYKSTVIFSEQGSAFTYEDTPSHALGIELAGVAIRRRGDFDERMTELLENSMRELEAVDQEQLDVAIERVKGKWWATPGSTRERMFDLGLDDGTIEPWLVPGMEGGEPVVFRLPELDVIGGLDCAQFFTVQIDPNVLEGFKIRERLAGSPEHINPQTDFPVLITGISEHLTESPEPLPELEESTTHDH